MLPLLLPPPWCRAWWQQLRARTNGLPASLLAVMFLLGFLEAFPLTAYGQWLKDDIRMPPATQSTFYATVFLPWSLKPLYAFVSQRLPLARGRRRVPYIVLCCLASAASYVLVATVAHSQAQAFAFTLARTAANACSQMMVNLLLVDCAARHMANAGAIQSLATAIDALSACTALLLGLPMYPCGSHYGRGTSLSPRQIIGINAIFPLLAALLALWIPDAPVAVKRRFCGGLIGYRPPCEEVLSEAGEPEVDKPVTSSTERTSRAKREHLAGVKLINSERQSTTDDNESVPLLVAGAAGPADPSVDSSNVDDGAASDDDTLPPARMARRWTQFSENDLLLPAVLLLLCWAALKDLMSQRAWLQMLIGVLAVDGICAGFIIRKAHRTRAFRSWRQSLRRLRDLWPAVVLFCINAVPDSSDQIYYYYYDVFENETCAVQWLDLTSSLSQLAGSALFFAFFNGRTGKPLFNLLVIFGILSAAACMLFYPMVHGDIPQRPGHVLPYAIMSTLVSGVIGQIAFVSGLVVVTQACPLDGDNTGFMYAVYLSFLDIGDSVGGWITAPVASSLGITASDLSNVGKLVIIGAGSSAVALLTTPLLYMADRREHRGDRASRGHREIEER